MAGAPAPRARTSTAASAVHRCRARVIMVLFLSGAPDCAYFWENQFPYQQCFHRQAFVHRRASIRTRPARSGGPVGSARKRATIERAAHCYSRVLIAANDEESARGPGLSAADDDGPFAHAPVLDEPVRDVRILPGERLGVG